MMMFRVWLNGAPTNYTLVDTDPKTARECAEAYRSYIGHGTIECLPELVFNQFPLTAETHSFDGLARHGDDFFVVWNRKDEPGDFYYNAFSRGVHRVDSLNEALRQCAIALRDEKFAPEFR